MKYYLFLFGAVLALQSCSSTRYVKPLKAREVAVGLDFGGPMIDFAGIVIPLPRTSLSAGYGIDSNWTAYGALHTTDLAFGLVHVEGGALRNIIPAKGMIPGLTAGASAHFMIDGWKGQFRAYPQIDINGYWQYLKKKEHFFYLNFTSWFDFWPRRAHGEKSKSLYTPAFSLGHTFEFKRVNFTLEMKYIAPFTPNRDMVTSYNGIAGRGTLGAFLGVNYRFFAPEKKRK